MGLHFWVGPCCLAAISVKNGAVVCMFAAFESVYIMYQHTFLKAELVVKINALGLFVFCLRMVLEPNQRDQHANANAKLTWSSYGLLSADLSAKFLSVLNRIGMKMSWFLLSASWYFAHHLWFMMEYIPQEFWEKITQRMCGENESVKDKWYFKCKWHWFLWCIRPYLLKINLVANQRPSKISQGEHKGSWVPSEIWKGN